ncbi:MAG: hypothetical protein AVDCRST_MAG30-2933, partial [uncultured Solirubrobacteraceae bacterium]
VRLLRRRSPRRRHRRPRPPRRLAPRLRPPPQRRGLAPHARQAADGRRVLRVRARDGLLRRHARRARPRHGDPAGVGGHRLERGRRPHRARRAPRYPGALAHQAAL